MGTMVSMRWLTVFAVLCSLCAAAPSDTATSASKKILTEIGDMINPKVDPCNNFHDYICSNQNVSVIEEIDEKVQERIANLIDRVPKSTDGTAIKKYYEFYERCENTKKEMDLSEQQYPPSKRYRYNHSYEILANVMWYYLTFVQKDIDHLVNPGTMAKMVAYLHAQHNFKLVFPTVVINPVKKAEFIAKHNQVLRFEMPTLSKSMLYYDPKFRHLNAGIVKDDLTDVIDDTVEPLLTAWNQQIEDLPHTISVLTKMEYQIVDVLRSNNVEEIEEMTVKEAMERMPEFDWKAYILTLEKFSNANITKNCKVEDFPLQFESINATAQTLKILSTLTTQDYLIYILTRTQAQIVADSVDLINNSTIDCNVLTQRTFPLVKQHLYITETYSKAERERLTNSISKIIDKIHRAVTKVFEKVSWIRNDKKTYQGYLDKIMKMNKTIGYAAQLLDQNWLDKEYSDFNMDLLLSTKYSAYKKVIQFYLNAQEYIAKKKLEKREDETYDYTEVNAGFYPMLNRFIINIAYLHQKVFDPDYVAAVNYGILGHTIAHEMFHGFEAKGINYNGDGHLMKLSDQSKRSFDSMTQCVVDEYSRFNITDSDGKSYNIDGHQTLLENLADLGGMAAAYDAFINDPDSKKPIPLPAKLKGLSNEQLFFVSYARFWCKADSEDNLLQTFDDEHSPNRFRIVGVLRNFVPFRKAFKCPVNSAYAPEKHCNVYTPQ